MRYTVNGSTTYNDMELSLRRFINDIGGNKNHISIDRLEIELEVYWTWLLSFE